MPKEADSSSAAAADRARRTRFSMVNTLPDWVMATDLSLLRAGTIDRAVVFSLFKV